MEALAAPTPLPTGPSAATKVAPEGLLRVRPDRHATLRRTLGGARLPALWPSIGSALLTALTALSVVVILASVAVSVGPRFAPFEAYVVLSGSMEPLIRVGSVEVVRPVPPATLQAGDIITYQRIEEPLVIVTHRITQITPATAGPVVRTKGDANEVEDPWDLQLRGTAWKHLVSVPLAGFILVFAQNAPGRIVTVVIPAALLSALWLYELWHRRRVVTRSRSAGVPTG